MIVPCVRIKSASVQCDPLTPTLARLIGAVDLTARALGHDLVITDGRESHPSNDVHTKGAALDVRASDLSPGEILEVHHYLTETLGPAFTVLYESPTIPSLGSLRNIVTVNPSASAPHFHIQSKKGTTYPPQDAPTSEGLKA